MPIDTSFIADAFELSAVGHPGSEFHFDIEDAKKGKSKSFFERKRINNNYSKKYYPKHWQEMYSLNVEG